MPPLVVLGGVQSDEYEGIHAVHRVCDGLDPSELTGKVLGVPVCITLGWLLFRTLSPHYRGDVRHAERDQTACAFGSAS